MSRLLTVKLRRDLRAMWARVLMMTIAIAVSLTAFGGVLFAWAASGREASDAYASTEPASATILLDQAIDAEQMAAIIAQARNRPGVIEATGRTQFTSDVEVNGQPRTIPLQVFVAAPDDPMRIAKFFMRQRSWPPSAGELSLGRDTPYGRRSTTMGVARRRVRRPASWPDSVAFAGWTVACSWRCATPSGGRPVFCCPWGCWPPPAWCSSPGCR